MILVLERNIYGNYDLYIFPRIGTVDYVFTMPVSYRGCGEFEMHSWNSIFKVWPNNPGRLTLLDLVTFIKKELLIVDPRFRKLTGSFLTKRLKAMERAFKAKFDLIILRKRIKRINRAEEPITIVEFNES